MSSSLGILFLANFILILCMVDSRGIAGNVKLVAMNGNQYWFSTSSPYAPTLNFHLAYQYCRTLGLQLAVLDNKEEVESIGAYLSKEANPMTHSRYWTSGNRLGAESWIWMSTGEQLNTSFTDFWLKNTGSSSVDHPRHCMSIKPPINVNTKRSLFTAEECGKPLPFICEQVRCLYYNYPVVPFPDPNELRTDIEEPINNTSPAGTPAEAESRTSIQYSTSQKVHHPRNKLFPSSNSNSEFSLSDIIIAEESGRTTQRRITLRPVMSVYPIPTTTMTSTSTTTNIPEASTRLGGKRTFKKKTTRDALWGTTTTMSSDEATNNGPTTTKEPKTTSTTSKKPVFYVTAKPIKPIKLNSKRNNSSSTNRFAPQFEIITSKSSHVGSGSDEEYIEDTTVSNPSPPSMLYHRYGTGSNPADTDEIFGSGYVSTDASNSNDVDESSSSSTTTKHKKFWKQKNRRQGPTTTASEESGSASGEILTTLLPLTGNRRRSKELAQYHSPSKMKQYHQLQRKSNKPSLSWVNSKEKDSGEKVTQASTSEEKVSLGPRLKLRLRTFN